jgi:hypothetical protein
MSNQISKFQMTEAYNWSGLTTKNHLGALFGQNQQILSKTMIRLLAASGLNNLDTVLSRYPVKKLETDDDFTWKLVGTDDKNVPLLYAYEEAGTPILVSDTNVGANGVIVNLVFPERYFTDVNVLVGEKLEIYQFRVISEPVRNADGWVYETQLMGPNTDGVPGSELVANKRFSKDFSPVEDTMSVKGGGIHFASPVDMRQSFTTLRMEHKEPGNNLNRRVASQITGRDANGAPVKPFTVWMQYVEWQFERQWSQEKARACMYARSNRSADGTYHDIGKSGFYIKQGAGIREQMEVSNTVFYNDFSLPMLESILSDMVEGKVEVNERSFIMRTGTRGASQFSKAVTAEASGWVALRGDNPANIFKTPSELHNNAFKAGYQFTEWEAPNGIRVKVEVDSMYDDKVRNKVPHPKGGVAESYRYDIMWMGPEDEPNIQKIETNQGDYRGYLAGIRNPFTGEINNTHMGTMEDSATYTRMGCMACVVYDPSRTATLLPTLLA